MKTCNVYNKHLTFDKRIEIEKGIEENKNFTQIGLKISKSPKTVSNEILRNRQIEHCLSWVSKHKTFEKTLKPLMFVMLVLLEKVVEKLDIITMQKMLKLNIKENFLIQEKELI